MRYYVGKAIPGEERRSETLDTEALSQALQESLAPGTFNVSLTDTPDLGLPDLRVVPYSLWACRISTTSMIERDAEGLRGWIIRVDGEAFPSYFVEIIAPNHLRTAMKRQNFPTFPVEIALNCGKEV